MRERRESEQTIVRILMVIEVMTLLHLTALIVALAPNVCATIIQFYVDNNKDSYRM